MTNGKLQTAYSVDRMRCLKYVFFLNLRLIVPSYNIYVTFSFNRPSCLTLKEFYSGGGGQLQAGWNTRWTGNSDSCWRRARVSELLWRISRSQNGGNVFLCIYFSMQRRAKLVTEVMWCFTVPVQAPLLQRHDTTKAGYSPRRHDLRVWGQEPHGLSGGDVRVRSNHWDKAMQRKPEYKLL